MCPVAIEFSLFFFRFKYFFDFLNVIKSRTVVLVVSVCRWFERLVFDTGMVWVLVSCAGEWRVFGAMSGGWEPPADATANSSFALDIIDLYCRPAQPEAETTNQQNTDRLEIEKELSEAFETSEVPLRTAITDSITAYISLKPILTLIGDYAVPVYGTHHHTTPVVI